MKKIILTLLLSLSYCASVFALNLTAEVDRTTIASNESLRLTVTADERASETIDFDQLNLQFDVISNRRSSQTSIINGQVSSNTQWTLILSPKESGQLVIPSFEYRGVYSQAITITVDDNYTNNTAAQDRDVFLQVKVDKNDLYVQEQLLITMRLYYRTSLSGYDSEELQIDNTTINLVSENNFQVNVKGVNYNVLEKIYSLHPQSSGKLLIPAQSWRLEKSVQRFNFGRSDNPYLYVRSEPIDIDVRPIATNSTADIWLPSNEITLNGEWQQSIVNAKVGEPLNYKLILIANGLTAAQLPNITIPDTDKFTIYADQPDIKDTKSQAGIIGTRVNNFAVIPRSKGTFIFPEITLKWWNIETNKEEIARIPEQTIVVAASDIQPDTTPNINTTTEAVSINATPAKSASIIWQWLAIMFALTTLVLGVLLIKNYRKPHTVSPTTTNTDSDSGRRQVLKTINTIAREKNWAALRHAIIEYGRHLTGKEITSLDELGQTYPDLQADFKNLDNYLYGKGKNSDYSPEALLNKINSIKKITENKIDNAKKLAELYKN